MLIYEDVEYIFYDWMMKVKKTAFHLKPEDKMILSPSHLLIRSRRLSWTPGKKLFINLYICPYVLSQSSKSQNARQLKAHRQVVESSARRIRQAEGRPWVSDRTNFAPIHIRVVSARHWSASRPAEIQPAWTGRDLTWHWLIITVCQKCPLDS